VGVAVPRGTEPRSDEAIVALIESRFHLHRRLAELPIHVVAVGGDVLLLGVVPTDVEKILAGRFALDTAGVERVDNQLSILPLERSSEAAPTVRSDAALVDDAQMALKLSRALAESAITVTVRRGVARLAGVVSSEGDRVYVDEIVGGVPGIRWVRNGLLVQSGSN
jgi:osmotically-inducible protein OsmY